MEKRYNLRIYPTSGQESQIQKNFGCVRFVYNYYLAKRIKAHKNGQGILNLNECCRDLIVLKKLDGFERIQEADDNSLRNSIRELNLAYKAFFRNVKKGGLSVFQNSKANVKHANHTGAKTILQDVALMYAKKE